MYCPLSTRTKGAGKEISKWRTLFAKKSTKVHEECLPESVIRMCGICCCLFVDNQSSRSSFQVGRFNYLNRIADDLEVIFSCTS